MRNPAPSQHSLVSPEILASLPEWVDPDDERWSTRELERLAQKPCTACGEWKLRTEFHVMRSISDGRYPRCKACRRNERLHSLGRLPAEDSAPGGGF